MYSLVVNTSSWYTTLKEGDEACYTEDRGQNKNKEHSAIGRRGLVADADLPVRLSVEKGTRGVNVNHLLVYECPVALLRVFLSSVTEETAADCFLHTYCGLTA